MIKTSWKLNQEYDSMAMFSTIKEVMEFIKKHVDTITDFNIQYISSKVLFILYWRS